jgi:hypothetical protein
MAILEYKLHKTDRGMVCPGWVEDGGYWGDPDNHTLIGWSPDEANREYYIPDTVTTLTQSQLVTRVLDIDTRYPMTDIDGNEMADSDITIMVNNWTTSRG